MCSQPFMVACQGAISPDGKYAFNMASTKASKGPLEHLIVTHIEAMRTKVLENMDPTCTAHGIPPHWQPSLCPPAAAAWL